MDIILLRIIHQFLMLVFTIYRFVLSLTHPWFFIDFFQRKYDLFVMNKDETLFSHSTNKGEQARKLLSKSLRQERVEFEMNSIQ